MAGKGESPRPSSVDQKTWDKNWDLAFSKKKKNNTVKTKPKKTKTVKKSKAK